MAFILLLGFVSLSGVFGAAILTHVWLEVDPTPPATFLGLLFVVMMTIPAPKRAKAAKTA